ncbi:MAG TPA: dihydrolipoamide acetyltransferase [Deltaproteobacteria bacterium]|nr:dihydrolipoamide acetyltransferase [Deltaproteobacteria bacterium]
MGLVHAVVVSSLLGLAVGGIALAQEPTELPSSADSANAPDEPLEPPSPPGDPSTTGEEPAVGGVPGGASEATLVEEEASEFRRELRTVEEDVSNLKERVFRSKATLKLLKELVIDAAASGSRVVLWHVNKLRGGYSMESIQYFLNGKNVFSKVDPGGSLDTVREIKVHEQTVPPGTHNLQVNMVLRGKGYKIFSYLRTYQFKVQSSYTFKVEEGKISLIRVLADSRGGLRNFVERPTIQYDERKETFREE